jgi:hypothetical protein
MKKLLYLLLVLSFATTTAFAQDDDEDDDEMAAPKKTAKAAKSAKKAKDDGEGGGMKLGFYGSIAGGVTLMDVEGYPVSSLGLLFNLGNGLEIGLGIGYANASVTITPTEGQSTDRSFMTYEIIPSISYQFGKAEAISFGAGLDIHLSSWSETAPGPDGNNLTTEPLGMTMAFFPNFNIRAELAKNFQVGLKAGLMVVMPPEEKDDWSSTKTTAMGTRTEVGFNYYIDM